MNRNKLNLFQVFRQILTSLRLALRPEIRKKGRSCKARLHNLTQVTGRKIAYTCVIVSSLLFLPILTRTNLSLRLVLHFVV